MMFPLRKQDRSNATRHKR